MADDEIGKPVGFGFGSPFTPAPEGIGGVKGFEPEQRDYAREREQLLGAIWVLVDRLGGCETVKFADFTIAAENGAHLRIKTSAQYSMLTLYADRKGESCRQKSSGKLKTFVEWLTRGRLTTSPR